MQLFKWPKTATVHYHRTVKLLKSEGKSRRYTRNMCNMRKRGIRVGVLVLKCLPQIFYPVILGTLTWRWPRSTLATSHELKFIAPKYFLHNLLWRQKGRGR